MPGAWFTLVHGPARTAMAVSALAVLVTLAALLKGSERFPQFVLLAFTVAGIGLGRRSIGDDRLSGRSVLLFQRPVRPVAHYGARLLLCVGVLAVGTAVIALATVMASPALLWPHAVAGLYWGALLLVMTTTLSSVAGRFEGELVIAFVVTSVLQVVVARELGSPVARELLYWVLVPIDVIFGTWNQIAAGIFAIRPAAAAHLIGYPAAWLAVLYLRLRRIDIGAADYHAN